MTKTEDTIKDFLVNEMGCDVVGFDEAIDQDTNLPSPTVKIRMWAAKDGTTEIGTCFNEDDLDSVIERYKEKSVRGKLGMSEIKVERVSRRTFLYVIQALIDELSKPDVTENDEMPKAQRKLRGSKKNKR